ncbi:uncharacterized protein [Amphiura filiformis]|uniref:uncharacterized protein n=1 Tax=Amphiura filiformis TaxID=82378 RepID=UPI003B21FA25
MATSSKEISVFVPERKRNRVQKRYAKRKTTVRAFTFVKDWQSPALEVHHASALSSATKKSKGPVLANSSIISTAATRSSAASVSDVSRNPLSPASLSRVSPSPVIIPNQSPRARLIAANQQKVASPARSSQVSSSPPVSQSSSQESAKESSSHGGSSTTFRTPMSLPSSKRTPRSQTSSQSSTNSKSSSSSSHSSVRLQSRPRSSAKSQSSKSVRSSQRKGTRSSSRLQDNNDSLATNSNNNSTKQVNRSRRRDQSKVDTEEEEDGDDEKEEDGDDDNEEDRSASRDDQQSVVRDDQVEGAGDIESEDDQDDGGMDKDDGGLDQDDGGQDQLESEDDGREDQEVTRQETNPTPEPTPSVHIVTAKTPAEKALRIVHRTPVSGPVNRGPAKRRRPSPVGRKDAKQAKKTQQKRTVVGSKAKVRLWIGGGRRRTAVDTTDLDIVLAKIEDMATEYRQNQTSKTQKRAVGRFYQYIEKDLTDKIDLAQEYKTLKSSLSRMNNTTRKQRKQLLELQQRNVRLDMQIAEMKKQQSGDQEKKNALHNISSFLTNLQNLQKEYAATKPQDDKKSVRTSSNLGALLTEAKATSQSRRKLQGINNQLQDWLDIH